MKNVLITGATGLVGTEVKQLLDNSGFETGILTTRKSLNIKNSFYWNYEKGYIDSESLEFADIIIHLAGENISEGRWTKDQKQKILDSRIKTSQLLFNAIKNSTNKPEKIISASATGYYGTGISEKIFKENDAPGNDFLAQVVDKWEQSILKFKTSGISYNILRFGLVISPDGGFMKKMSTPMKYFAGSVLGTGNQYMPWIEISDLARLILYLIENDIENEVFNAVAPNHITNKEFTNALSKAMKRPVLLPAFPEFMLRILFGEMAQVIISGTRVSGQKLIDAGFKFKYDKIEKVLGKYYADHD